MEKTYLPGTLRDRLRDLIQEEELGQGQVAEIIGISESAFSRFMSSKTDKLGSEYVIRLARYFQVSTDFLLGVTDSPDRKNYDIGELNLSVQAASNLYTQKVHPKVISFLLENENFARATVQIAQYMDGNLAAGFATQNQIYDSVAQMMYGYGLDECGRDVDALKNPKTKVELVTIQDTFMQAVQELKTDFSLEQQAEMTTKRWMEDIIGNLTKGSDLKTPKVTPGQVTDAIMASIEGQNLVTEPGANFIRFVLGNFMESVAEQDKENQNGI